MQKNKYTGREWRVGRDMLDNGPPVEASSSVLQGLDAEQKHHFLHAW